MKYFKCSILASFLLVVAINVAANESSGIDVKVVEVSASGHVVVSVSNSSPGPIRVFRESNSWGADRWRLILVRDGQAKALFQSTVQVFTRNIPLYDELPSKAGFMREFEINSQGWQGANGEALQFLKGDTVIVIYDVPYSQEGNEFGVWSGVAVGVKILQ